MDIQLISLLIGMSIGIFIVGAMANLVRYMPVRELTEEQRLKREETRKRFDNLSPNRKLGIAVGLVAFCIGIALLIFFTLKILTPYQQEPVILGYHPYGNVGPEAIGMYLGVAILMTIMRMIIVIDFKPDDDDPQPTSWRETLLMLFSVPSLLDSLSFCVVLWLAVVIGSKRVPYGEMLGINPAEFAGVVKTTSVILVTLFVFETAEVLGRFYKDMRKGSKTGSPGGAEQGDSVDAAAAGVA